jgi:hypothetical protein
MYNRILNRPMFKLGGKTIDAQGTGITSGLDTPRSNYLGGGRTIGGGAFTGTPMGNRTGFQNIYESVDVSVPESTRKRAFWSGIGQGFSNADTLGEALSGAVTARDKILGPAEALAAERQFQLDKGGIEKEYDRESAVIIQGMDDASREKVATIASQSTATAQKILSLKEQLKNGQITQEQYNSDLAIINTGFNKLKEATALAKVLIQTTYPDLNTPEGQAKLIDIIMTLIGQLEKEVSRKGEATGGRIGYQFGATNQGVQPMQASLNVDETIQTPTETIQEDVSVQEKIQPSVNMTYQEFRAKMPPQVDDEIVQLIYYNQDAFADFAQIKTQDEVYAFNNKWGVSLALPFDTEIT